MTMDLDFPSPLAGSKRKQDEMEPTFIEMNEPSVVDAKNIMHWERMQATIAESMNVGSIQGALDVITELRDNLELVHSTEYPTMLSTMLPLFASILKSVPCTPSTHAYLSFVGEAHSSDAGSPASPFRKTAAPVEKVEYTIRHSIMELCTRLPHNEILRPFVLSLLSLCLQILRYDYEDNALLAVRLFFELHKNFRPSNTDHVQPFLDFVLVIYRELPSNAQRNFVVIHDTPDVHPMIPRFDSETLKADPSLLALKSTQSFRVLMECPLTVMLLFNLYPKFIKKNLSATLPIMMESLTHRPPKHAHSSSISSPTNRGEQHNSFDIDIKGLYYKRAREFLAAQVKTLSFVTHLLRGYADQLRPFENILTNSVLNLFHMCPREAVTTRRDLLFSLRHIFATSFRRGFMDHIDTLLDERILLGRLRLSEHTNLKAIAYTTLGDLLLHARSKLTMSQISRVVHIYSRVLHDTSMNLPLTVQTSSARLLITLVDPVYHNTEDKASSGRNILFKILETLVSKLGTLLEHGISDVKKNEEEISKISLICSDKYDEDILIPNDEFISDQGSIRDDLYGPEHAPVGTMMNVRELVKPTINGIKTLIWCICNYGNQREKLVKEKDLKSKSKSVQTESSSSQRPQWYEDSAVQTLNSLERDLIGKYFDWTLNVLKLLKDVIIAEETKDQYRQFLESFASSLTVLDSFNFQRIVGPKVKLLIGAIIDDGDLMKIAEHLLLSSSNTTSDFAACLMIELMRCSDKNDVGIQDDTPAANVKMSLFNLIFSSVTVYPKNERILRPYIQPLVSLCLRRAVGCDSSKWPDNHLTLIRKLFRTITNGKNEDSYKEIVPLLATLLNGLYRIFCHSHDILVKKIIIEICITLPARLSSLLPHLSLLLRIIIPALKSGEGELINAGLRTLEFWVEHLNPEFLNPLLTSNEDLLSELMSALAIHLQPAPYQYGLLTVRLLGKLGGTNRAFLNIPMNVQSHSNPVIKSLSAAFAWEYQSKNAVDEDLFYLDVPVQRATEVLKHISSIVRCDASKSAVDHNNRCVLERIHFIIQDESSFKDIDVASLKSLFLNETTKEQSEAALVVLRSAVEMLLEISNSSKFDYYITEAQETNMQQVKEDNLDDVSDSAHQSNTSFSFSDKDCNTIFKCVLEGLIYAKTIIDLKSEADLLIKSILHHFVLTVASQHKDVNRIDYTTSLDTSSEDKSDLETKRLEPPIQNGKLASLSKFGRFIFSGKLNTGVNFFLPTEMIAESLVTRREPIIQVCIGLISELLQLLEIIELKSSVVGSKLKCFWMESLLLNLLQECFKCEWEDRYGIFQGISFLLSISDQSWCKKFELDLLHLSFFCLKEIPSEAVLGQKEATVFFRQLIHLLYTNKNHSRFLDKFSHKDLHGDENDLIIHTIYADTLPLTDAVCDFLFSELSSNRSIVRIASRIAITFLFGNKPAVDPDCLAELFKKQSSSIRRILFSRSLRHLQLQDQIATIELFTYTITHAPEVLPISDNQTVVFLSELLKILSVGDGEMTSDSIPSSSIVDKDGYCPTVPFNSCMVDKLSALTHSTSLFLRSDFVITQGNLHVVRVEGDLPIGVQYRVSTLRLFGTVLKDNCDTFLEAESSSSLGNILPHIVSLLFRSLASRPEEAVELAHSALHEILRREPETNKEGSHSKHGLPRQVLQLCVRPVLLNLRDYTKLTIPLLRGLSRLMSLLASWFSKTLGEKLLELLQRWYEPDKILSLRVWKQGEEPLIAAELINMFQMLPDESSNFVEPLIKTTLKLEAVLHNYMGCFIESPFRSPLSKYLNKHGPAVVLFFINERRLKNPIYSELLQDLARREECDDLRKHLSSIECSTMLLNVCFERPLAIIRSEKSNNGLTRSLNTSSSPRFNSTDTLTMHGIIMDVPSKKAALEQQIKLKEEKLKVVKKEESKTKDLLDKEINLSQDNTSVEKQKTIDSLKQKHTRTAILVETAEKELSSAKAEYSHEMALLNSQSTSNEQRDNQDNLPTPMSFDTLELQYQGFALTEALIKYDPSYVSVHHNLFRTFRWLWRSKGRHFRLLHEEVMPSRFISESRYLASFTVAYSKKFHADIEILFDLVRTFLQPTSADFTFVRDHLHDTVCNRLPLEQKKKVLMRFLPVIVSEGLEELKVVTCQNIMIPMLKHSLSMSSSVSKNLKDMTDDVINERLYNKSIMDGSIDDSSDSGLIDTDFLCKLIDDVLTKDTIKEFGARVTIELLKVCCLLLDHARHKLGDKQQDIVQFAWKVLKCDEPRAKQWAYILICKVITYFETPPRTILQVYDTLLRSNAQEIKDLVRSALDILVPKLPDKLSPDYLSHLLQSTVKILQEEANSPPHVYHIWYTVVRHQFLFYKSRNKLIPHLVSSLNKLGLPANSSPESKELSVALVEVLLKWDQHQNGQKNKADIIIDDELDFTLESSQSNTVINFLVRLILLLSVSDRSEQKLGKKLSILFKKVIIRWGSFQIRVDYFEKVLSMCQIDIRRDEEELREQHQKKGDKIAVSSTNFSKQNKGIIESATLPKVLLTACLDIFLNLIRYAPTNPFLDLNAPKLSNLIRSSFKYINEEGSTELWHCLALFVEYLFKSNGFPVMKQMMRYLLEDFLISGFDHDNILTRTLPTSTKSKKEKYRYDVIEKALSLINTAMTLDTHFVSSFTKVIITAANWILKNTSHSLSKDRKTVKSSFPFALVNEALLENACKKSGQYYSIRTSKTSISANAGDEIEDEKPELECLFRCIFLLRMDPLLLNFSSDRKRYIALICDILENVSDVKVLVLTVLHISRWLLAKDGESPLTKSEMKLFLNYLILLDSRHLPLLGGEILMCALALITCRIHIAYFNNAERIALKSVDGLRPLIERNSIKFLMSTKPNIRALFINLFVEHDSPNVEISSCVNSSGFEYLHESTAVDETPIILMKRVLQSDLQVHSFQIWTAIFSEVLLACAKHCESISGMLHNGWVIHTVPDCNPIDRVSLVQLKNEHAFALTRSSDHWKKFIAALRVLSSADISLSHSFFEVLFQAAWKSCQSAHEKLAFVPFLENALLQSSHVQFLKSASSKDVGILQPILNSVKSLLRAICSLEPLPMIDIDILISCASNYGCWHEVRRMLEMQYTSLVDLSDTHVSDYKHLLLSAIRRCYLEVGEKDTWLTFKAYTCDIPGLQNAVALDMYNKVSVALDSYTHLLDELESELGNAITNRADMERNLSFLEERWIALQRESCAWSALNEFSGDNGPVNIMIEGAWKTKNWEKLRTLSSSPSAISSLENGDLHIKLSEILLAISDGKLHDVENLHAQAAQLCLYNWQLLPPIYSGCNAHRQILHTFHRLVDIRESGQMMVEASHHTSNKSHPDFKNMLSSWRNRLPCPNDPLIFWEDILQWRSHIFSSVAGKFHWVEQNTLAAMHDRAWAAMRLAKAAREDGIDDISLMAIGKLSDCAMAVGDAFFKLTEQILLYKNGGESERRAGLNLISTTNLSFFDATQKSELFRLKGDFLDLIANSYNGKTKASQAYCHAVQLCPTYYKSWISWGGLCWSLGEILERQHRSLGTETDEDKEKKESMGKKFVQYYAQAMGCYLQAIQCDTSEETRLFIPRILLCLAKDGSKPDLLCQTFEKYSLALPPWVWLPWIPQLLSSLCRSEAKTVKAILNSVLFAYPQALYYSLRSFYLERRDIERSKSSSESVVNQSPLSSTFAEELMSNLRKTQPMLWIQLETIIEELIIRFRPSHEEELLATITALVTRVDAQIESQQSNKLNDTECDTVSIHASFRKTLSRISTKFFSGPTTESTPSTNDQWSRRTAEFTMRYKEAFIKDFQVSALEGDEKKECKLPLGEIIIQLKKWKCILEKRISSSPPKLPLVQLSSTLSSFTNIIPDLWPGACGPDDDRKTKERLDVETDSSTTPKSSLAASIELAQKAASTVCAANARENFGDGRGGGWTSVEVPGQYAPNTGFSSKPSPELHVKLVKFEPAVEVSRRNQQLVRRIGMKGSDGRVHNFLLQFAIPYWTRADERTAQLHQIFDRCLRKESISSRRHLWYRPTAVLPVAQRLRMIAEERHHVSLEQIFTQECERINFDEHSIPDLFMQEMKKYGDQNQVDESSTTTARAHALNIICKDTVSSSILKRYICGLYGTAEQVYQIQRSFTTQTALNSLLQYAFEINERTPSKFMFNYKNGHVLSPEFRLSYSNQGFIDEKRSVPFRLTRNIETFIGPFLLKGVFTPAMASAATAICANEADLEQTLQLLFRDDIVSWYISKSSGTQRPIHELERQLSDRVRKNIYLVQNRLRECSILEFKGKENQKSNNPIDNGVQNLIAAATSIDNLSQMSSTYAPWL